MTSMRSQKPPLSLTSCTPFCYILIEWHLKCLSNGGTFNFLPGPVLPQQSVEFGQKIFPETWIFLNAFGLILKRQNFNICSIEIKQKTLRNRLQKVSSGSDKPFSHNPGKT